MGCGACPHQEEEEGEEEDARGMRRVSAPIGHGLEEELGQVLLVVHDLLHLLDPLDITIIPAVDTRERGVAPRSPEEPRYDGTNILAAHFFFLSRSGVGAKHEHSCAFLCVRLVFRVKTRRGLWSARGLPRA